MMQQELGGACTTPAKRCRPIRALQAHAVPQASGMLLETPAALPAFPLKEGIGHIISIAIAVPSPPPMHSEAMPRLPPVFFKAPIRVTMMRAPEAPIG